MIGRRILGMVIAISLIPGCFGSERELDAGHANADRAVTNSVAHWSVWLTSAAREAEKRPDSEANQPRPPTTAEVSGDLRLKVGDTDVLTWGVPRGSAVGWNVSFLLGVPSGVSRVDGPDRFTGIVNASGLTLRTTVRFEAAGTFNVTLREWSRGEPPVEPTTWVPYRIEPR